MYALSPSDQAWHQVMRASEFWETAIAEQTQEMRAAFLRSCRDQSAIQGASKHEAGYAAVDFAAEDVWNQTNEAATDTLRRMLRALAMSADGEEGAACAARGVLDELAALYTEDRALILAERRVKQGEDS